MTRARTDISAIDVGMSSALRILRTEVAPAEGSAVDLALTELETFVAIALRVLAKTNPSRVCSEAMNVEIQMRIAPGQP